MTFKYRATAGAGEAVTRIPRVVIENPRDGVPIMSVVEERLIDIGGEEVHVIPEGVTLSAHFDAAASFELRHPITDELLGSTSTHGELQTLVYSLCRHLQIERDGGVVL